MAGLEEVLERLDSDARFRHQLRTDPAAALAGYVLYDEDLPVVADRLAHHAGRTEDVTAQRTLEQIVAALTEAIELDPPEDGSHGTGRSPHGHR